MNERSDRDDVDALPISAEERDRLFLPLAAGRPLALCVSGGADSMALMHLVAEWLATPELQSYWQNWWQSQLEQHGHYIPPRINDAGLPVPNWLDGIQTGNDLLERGGPPPIVVVTVDHGLRPASADEAAFVASEAGKLSLPHQTLMWRGEKPVTGIQETAREARYGLLLDLVQSEAGLVGGLASAHRFSQFRRSLVMAHHEEDQAETVLMRLARGSGLEGLAGMRSMEVIERAAPREGTHGFSTVLWRPFLDIPKRRLVATLRAKNVKWIDDPSNNDLRFERVRIRKVMDELRPLGFTSKNVALSARRLRDAEDDLRWVHPPVQVDWHCGLFGEVMLEQAFLDHSYLVVRMLRRLLRAYGGSSKPAELAKIEALGKALGRRGGRAESGGVTLGGCKIEFAGQDLDVLRVFREGRGVQLPEVELNRAFDLDWDGGRFEISTNYAAAGAAVKALGMDGWAKLKRSLPELAKLGWPAAAMATMPVIAEKGEIVAYPVIEEVLRAREEDLPEKVADAWAGWSKGLKKHYSCRFCEPSTTRAGAVGPPPDPD